MADNRSVGFYSTIPAPGTKYYSDHAESNKDTCESALPMILECIEKSKLSEDEVFTICDYGAADGGTSISVIRRIIDELKIKYSRNQEVHVIYEDTDMNDYNALFNVVTGANGYTHDYDNVFVSVCSSSFYKQCFPRNSINLGLSFIALQCLSQTPCKIKDGISQFDSNISKEELSLLKEQATQDWETFLLQRSKEIKPGGTLLIVALCTDKEEFALGNKYGPSPQSNIYNTMSQIWKAIIKEGRITEEEFYNISLSQYCRTHDEFEEPFVKSQSKIVKAGLKLQKITTKIMPCRLQEKWVSYKRKYDKTEAALMYAKHYVNYLQAWSRMRMMYGLSDDRSSEEKNKIMDKYFMKYETEVAQNPSHHRSDMSFAFIHITKNL